MVTASTVLNHIKKANPNKAIKQYFVVDCIGLRIKFYALDDNAAYEYACSHFTPELRVYANIGGGIFIGYTKFNRAGQSAE